MNNKKDNVVCIILMNMVMAELKKIIEEEIDKGDDGNYSLVDLLIATNEELSLSCEYLEKDVI